MTDNKFLKVGKKVGHACASRGWEAFAVGGFVRDMVAGKASKDLDIEVFGPKSVAELVEFLNEFGEVNAVGRSFGVLKVVIDGVDLDVSLPRTESKTGSGHKGFVVKSDGTLTIDEAVARRDFTFNGLMLSLPQCKIVDVCEGVKHLKTHRLRHISSRFADDPLRVLRGMQFCGRFKLTAEKETVALARSLLPEFETLAKERLWIEFEKWAAKSIAPSRGLVFLLRSGWIAKFPELAGVVGVKQGAKHHPEGSVWQHTKLTVDAAAKIADREGLAREERVVLVLAALCHDLGKAVSTKVEDGKITSVGHAVESEKLTETFLTSIDAPKGVIKKVCALVREHMSRVETPKAVRKLAARLDVVSIEFCALLMEADVRGRKVKEPDTSGIEKMLEVAREIKVEAGKPKPILMGRHLIELGLKPGKEFGIILAKAFEAQLEGEFKIVEEAVEWVKTH